jgi:transketolase
MISCAAGLAVSGKVPFLSSFGKFITRGYDQLEMALISRANLKVVGSHVGLTPFSDGPSQMALADVAFFRAYSKVKNRSGKPFLYLLNPSDARAAYALTIAMAEQEGAFYLRAFRPEVPLLYDARTTFHPGGHHVLVQGKDLLLLATGYLVHEAMKALEPLREQGIEATLVDLYSLPFDRRAITRLAHENQGRILTVEDNYGAAFGSEVAEAMSQLGMPFHLEQMYVRRIPKSARTPDDLLRYLGLSHSDILKSALSMMKEAAA